MLEHAPNVVVLSTDYVALDMKPWQHAMTAVYVGRAEIIEEHPTKKIHLAEGRLLPFPVKIRFISGVFAGAIKNQRPKRSSARRPNRKKIFARDLGICQYCKKSLKYENSTVDHVIPKSKGGSNDWDNLVLSCSPCNTKKGDKLVKDAGMKLVKKPVSPYYC